MTEQSLVATRQTVLEPQPAQSLKDKNQQFWKACSEYSKAERIAHAPSYTGSVDCIRPYSPSMREREEARGDMDRAFTDISRLLVPTTVLKLFPIQVDNRIRHRIRIDPTFRIEVGTSEGQYSLKKEIATLDEERTQRHIAGLERLMNWNALEARKAQWAQRMGELFEGKARWLVEQFDYNTVEMTVWPGAPYFGEAHFQYQFHYNKILIDRWGLEIVNHPAVSTQ